MLSGILNQNRARFWNESMHGLRDAEKNHRDWAEIGFGMTGLKNSIRRARAQVARGSPSILIGSQVGFSGGGICLICMPGFGIESMHRMRDTENNHQADLIEEPYWGPLRMWVKTFWSIDLSDIALEAWMDNLHNIQASFRLVVFPVHLNARNVYYTTYKFQTAITLSWKILFIIVCEWRVFFIVGLTIVGSKPANHEWGSWYTNH